MGTVGRRHRALRRAPLELLPPLLRPEPRPAPLPRPAPSPQVALAVGIIVIVAVHLQDVTLQVDARGKLVDWNASCLMSGDVHGVSVCN